MANNEVFQVNYCDTFVDLTADTVVKVCAVSLAKVVFMDYENLPNCVLLTIILTHRFVDSVFKFNNVFGVPKGHVYHFEKYKYFEEVAEVL